jgi:hypothetical protein
MARTVRLLPPAFLGLLLATLLPCRADDPPTNPRTGSSPKIFVGSQQSDSGAAFAPPAGGLKIQYGNAPAFEAPAAAPQALPNRPGRAAKNRAPRAAAPKVQLEPDAAAPPPPAPPAAAPAGGLKIVMENAVPGPLYTNPVDHYSVQLPPAWKILTKDEVSRVMSQLTRMTGAPSVEFVVGFQRSDRPHFGYPYVLVQRHQVNTPTIEQMLKSAEKDAPAAFEKVADKMKGIANNPAVGQPTIDHARHILFMSVEMNVATVGPVKGLSALCLGRHGIAQFNFYAAKREYDLHLPDFQSMLDSFQWEPGYGYDEATAKANEQALPWGDLFGNGGAFNWDGAKMGGLKGALIGGGIGLFLCVVGALRKVLRS